MKKLLIENIGTLVTPEGRVARAGAEQGEVKTIRNAYIYIEDGIIKKVEKGEPDIDKLAADDVEILDAEGALVTPGLVDAHTHLVF